MLTTTIKRLCAATIVVFAMSAAGHATTITLDTIADANNYGG